MPEPPRPCAVPRYKPPPAPHRNTRSQARQPPSAPAQTRSRGPCALSIAWPRRRPTSGARSCAPPLCRPRTRRRGGARWRSCCWARSARRPRTATGKAPRRTSAARGSAARRPGRATRCTWSGKARRCTPSATSAGTRSSWRGTRTCTTPTTSSRGSSSRSGRPRTPRPWPSDMDAATPCARAGVSAETSKSSDVLPAPLLFVACFDPSLVNCPSSS
ncbi:hypothetical protein ACQJBY_011072 [Aegilops geniculata]